MVQRHSRRFRLVWLLAAAACSLSGCRDYEELGPEAYAYAQAMYGIAHRKANDRLPRWQAQLAAAEAEGEVSPREASWLRAIADAAEEGRWEEAQQESRRLMESQVRR